MSAALRERAESIGARPDVVRWVRRLQRCAKDMPADVWMYIASGTPTVMATGPKGEHVDDEHGKDRDGIIDTVEGGSWDGGDW